MYALGEGNSIATLDYRCLPIAIFAKTLHTLHTMHFAFKNNGLKNVRPYIDPTQLYIHALMAKAVKWNIMCFTRHYMSATMDGWLIGVLTMNKKVAVNFRFDGDVAQYLEHLRNEEAVNKTAYLQKLIRADMMANKKNYSGGDGKQ